MDRLEIYCKERISLYEKCYYMYEDYIDELTGSVVRVGLPKYGFDDDLINKLIVPLDADFKKEIVGMYVKCKSGRLLKTTYYRVLDMAVGGVGVFPTFRLMRMRRNFIDDVPITKVISSGYEIISKIDISKQEGWIENKRTLFKNKNLYIFRNEIGRIKIGISENIDQRVKAISAASGMKIEVLRIINFNGNLEWQLHKHFKSKRYIGEWFDLDQDDIDFLLKSDLENIFKKQLSKHQTKRLEL